ncbi:unnamed protein product, partial [Rotaria sp. Silwood2]
ILKRLHARFDNIVFAWLAIFQITTLESWASIMYYIQDAHSFWDWIYFVCLILIGSFVMMNLCLVVISAQFGITKKRETERMLAEQKRFSPSSTTVTNDQQGSCWEEIIKYFQRLSKRACKRFRICWKNYQQKRDKVNQRHHRKVTTTKKILTQNALPSSNVNIVSSIPLINQKHRPNCRHHQPESLLVPTPLSESNDRGTATCNIGPDVIAPTPASNSSLIEKNRRKNENFEFERQQQKEINDICNCYCQDETINTSDNNQEEEERVKFRQKFEICCYCCSRLTIIQKLISRCVASKHFDDIILSVIIINTLSMAIEHHGQPQSLTNILEYSNYVFIILFTIEMLFKIIAEGCLEYIKNPFNIFDGGIVVISLIELCGAKNSGLSVLRTFRLLRVLKLVQFMPTLRRQLVIMLKTLDSVAAFLLLLTLFVFIFSVLGMHLFGGEFCTLEAFNITSHQQIDIKCRCCACVEWSSLKNSTDLKDLKCIQERTNFDSLRFALLTVFQILTQEDWNEVLYNGMKNTSPWSALYFIALMIFGNYILLNLLVAILVESFQNEEENGTTNSNNSTDRLDKADPFKTQAIITGNMQVPENLDEWKSIELSNDDKKNDRRQNTLADTIRRTNSDRSFPLSSTRYLIAHEEKLIEQELNNIPNTCLNSNIKRRSTIDNSAYSFNQNVSTSICQTPRRQEKSDRHTEPNTNSPIQLAADTQLPVNDQNDIQLDVSTGDDTQLELTTQKSGVIRSCLGRLCGQRIFECLKKRENYSLYLFSPSNRLRKVFQRLILQKSFDYFILFFIALNCITFAMERPSISPISFERQFLNYTNYIFTAILTIEMMIKIIANGFIFGPNTYLHTGWNIMDGFLVFVSIVDLCTMNRSRITLPTESDTTSHILGMLRVFRLLRTLRAITIINRAPGLKLVVQTLLSSLRPIGNIVIICCIFFIIFGILGVQLFKGKLYYCEGPLADNVKTRQQCEAMPDHQWQNQQYNFDHLGHALLTLFVLSSKDGWVQIMHNGIDAVDVEMQPRRNYSESKFIYFISFILIVSFFVLNMFVGVVVENFHSCRAKQELEEEAQNKAKHAKKIERKQRLMRELSYYAHFSPWRKCLHDLCVSKYFDLIIATIIGVNVVTMSLEFYLMPPKLTKFLEYCNYVFTVVFLLEFIWKIVALGPSRYFRDKWNQLDSFIVLLSIVSIVMETMFSGHILPMNPTLIRVIRVLRIARVLKLLKMAEGVRALLDTVIQALPQVGNLGLLFFLLFFIFGTLGVELFGKLECSEEQPCSGLDKHAHFKNFGIALLTLFRVATGDNWNGIMKDTLRQDDSPHTGKNHFMTIISPIYFVIFVLMTQFVLINIVIAVLMKKLEDSNKMTDDDAEMDEEIERQLELNTLDGNNIERSLL